MPTYTYEDIFEQQLQSAEPLQQDSPQIEQERTDYFGDLFVVGDIQLFVQLVRGKTSGSQNTVVEIATITPRSWEQLLHYYHYEPQWDSRRHQPQQTAIPRFVVKPVTGDN